MNTREYQWKWCFDCAENLKTVNSMCESNIGAPQYLCLQVLKARKPYIIIFILLLNACSPKIGVVTLETDNDSTVINRNNIEHAYAINGEGSKRIVYLKLKPSGVKILSDFFRKNINKHILMIYDHMVINNIMKVQNEFKYEELEFTFDEAEDADKFISAMVN